APYSSGDRANSCAPGSSFCWTNLGPRYDLLLRSALAYESCAQVCLLSLSLGRSLSRIRPQRPSRPYITAIASASPVHLTSPLVSGVGPFPRRTGNFCDTTAVARLRNLMLPISLFRLR